MSANVYKATGPDGDSIFESSSKGFTDAATDARAAAKIAAQNVKDGFGWSVYKAAFGVSFGVVFTGVFLTELLPAQNVLRRGLEDGADAAFDAIEARKVPVGAEAYDEHDIADPVPAAKSAKPVQQARKPLASAHRAELKPTRPKARTSR